MNDGQIVDGIEFRRVSIGYGYWITNSGEPWSNRTGRIKRLNAGISPKGYPRVSILDSDGKVVTRYVHSLVLTAFVGPRPPGMEACHWDGDKTNNRIGNLRWDTTKANAADGKRLDEHARLAGSLNGRAVLSESDVSEIKRQICDGKPSTEIARDFGATIPMISKIKCGRSWASVPWPDGFGAQPARHAKLTFGMAQEIRSLSASGVNGRALARKFDVSDQTICNVLSGKLHRKEAG